MTTGMRTCQARGALLTRGALITIKQAFDRLSISSPSSAPLYSCSARSTHTKHSHGTPHCTEDSALTALSTH
jgi:hypothetical protein